MMRTTNSNAGVRAGGGSLVRRLLNPDNAGLVSRSKGKCAEIGL